MKNVVRYLSSSRVVSEYREDMPDGKKGCLFYISEIGTLCLIDTPYRKGDKEPVALHQSEKDHPIGNLDCVIAHGVPAVLLADREHLVAHDKMITFMREYQLDHSSVTTSPQMVLKHWLSALKRILPNVNKEGWFSMFDLMHVGQMIRDFCRPLPKEELAVDIFQPAPAVLRTRRIKGPKILMMSAPGSHYTEHLIPFPYLYLLDDLDDETYCDKQHIGLGFIAVLINHALYKYHRNHWDYMNFTNVETVKQVLKNYEVPEDEVILPEIDFRVFSLDFTIPYREMISQYVERESELLRAYVEHHPDMYYELAEGDNIYSYMLYIERGAYTNIYEHSPLYAAMTDEQRKMVAMYFQRYIETLQKIYHARQGFVEALVEEKTGSSCLIHLDLKIDTKVIHNGVDVTAERERMFRQPPVVVQNITNVYQSGAIHDDKSKHIHINQEKDE